ncbi:MAG TPA: hypothetical protein DEB39_05500 [Planctomycetaceae bacterium]|nr:hypothetical protein [Planctomycetaceae bacterium]
MIRSGTPSLPIFAACAVTAMLIVSTGCQTASYNNTDGVRYYGQAKYDQALRSFQLARGVDPEDADAHYNIAATYHKLGQLARDTGRKEDAEKQFTLAEENYRGALAKNSEHLAAYRGLAAMWSELGHSREAFELLQNWAERNPGSSDAKVELARLYQEYGKYNEAQQYLQSALAVDTTSARALRALGWFGEQAGRTDVALDQYRRSLNSNPDQQDLSEYVAQLEKNAQTPIALPYGYTPGIPQVASTSGIPTSVMPTSGALSPNGPSAAAFPGDGAPQTASGNQIGPF